MNKFSTINDVNDTHIRNLLDWLNREVLSACGDGDAIWISKFYSIDDLLPIVEDMNKIVWDSWWTVEIVDANNNFGRYLSAHRGQECFTITNNLDFPVPSWSQCTIIH